ncbi:MAG: methyltransferase domain-containing protein [Bdellovibrionales bacterium]|nr:methyltransferase domain-containing protein [Bdellovibrionales bacterium]
MNLRNILLLFSVVMIGFCLTLYFQADSSVRSMNIDQYKNLNYNKSRSHSLSEFNEKIVPYRIEDLISEIYEKNKLLGEKTRIMEIGFGNGRVLLELKKLFPEAEFYGINKEKTRTFYRRESFIMTALKFELMTKVEAENLVLPYVVFQDMDFGQRIPYDENKFDVIYSQSTLSNIRYTFELFNEIMRVLKKGGVSIHSDFTGVNVFSRGVMIPLKEATKEFRKKGIEIYVLDNPEAIRFKKPDYNALFPVTPHQSIPAKTDNLTLELKRPEMSYNFNH